MPPPIPFSRLLPFLLPPLVAAAFALGIYRGSQEAVADFEGRYERGFISGFRGHEHDVTPGYRWTSRNSYIRFVHLPAASELEVEVRLATPRPAGHPMPVVWFTANEKTVHQAQGSPNVRTYRFPVRLDATALSLGIHTETIFVPGLGAVGARIYSVRAGSAVGAVPLRPILWMMLAALLLLGAALAAGLPVRAASLVASTAIAGFVYLLAQEGVRFQSYPNQVANLAFTALVVAAASRWVLGRWTRLSRREIAIVVAILSASLLLKLAGLYYPLFISSDAVFQANRLQEVMEGNFFTTSVTQHEPPFRAPYPVSLYLLAVPWVGLGLEAVRVLQTMTAVLDVAVGLALVLLTVHFWKDFRAGILASVLYQLVPINFLAFSAGNLTNLFGVSTTVFFWGFILMLWEGRKRWVAVPAFLSSALALTAHLSTFLISLVLWPAWVAALHRTSEKPRKLVLWVATAGIAVAALYYTGYKDLFIDTWSRLVGGDTGVANTSTLSLTGSFLREQLGVVFLILASLGSASIVSKATSTPLHVTSSVWLAVTGLFFILGLTTPLGVRYTLQVLPLLALAAGTSLSYFMRAGRAGRAASWTALFVIVASGLWNLNYCLLSRYH